MRQAIKWVPSLEGGGGEEKLSDKVYAEYGLYVGGCGLTRSIFAPTKAFVPVAQVGRN